MRDAFDEFPIDFLDDKPLDFLKLVRVNICSYIRGVKDLHKVNTEFYNETLKAFNDSLKKVDDRINILEKVN